MTNNNILYVGPLASYLTLLSLPWCFYPKHKPMNLNANHYSLATLQVSDLGRPCAKPFPYVISLNPDSNSGKRGRLYHLVMPVFSWVGGPGQWPPYLSFIFPTEHRPHFLSSQPNSFPLHPPTLPGFYSIFFRASSIIVLHINRHFHVIKPFCWHSQICSRVLVFFSTSNTKVSKGQSFC